MSTLGKSNISFLIPVYNEELILEKNIRNFIEILQQKGYRDFEIILSENGSTDTTNDLINTLARDYPKIVCLHLEKPNFGLAIKEAAKIAKYPSSVLLNADWLDVDFVDKAIPLLDEYSIVVGSKEKAGGDHRPVIRRLASRLLTLCLRQAFGYRGTDSHGLKAFRTREGNMLLNQCSTNQIIESELLVRAIKSNIAVTELPISVSEIRPPRISFYHRCFKMAHELLELKRAIRNISSTDHIRLHADDFGLNKHVNKKISQLLQLNRLSSVSVLANGQQSSEVPPILKNAQVEVFLHFNIVEGYPLLPREMIPSLVSSNGNYYPRSIFMFRLMLSLIKEKDVRLAFMSQWQRAMDLGIPINGIDSHQHVHAFAPISYVLEEERLNNNLPFIRSYKMIKTHSLQGRFVSSIFRFIALWTELVYQHRLGLPITWRKESWRPFSVATWESISPKTVNSDEVIVCHPGSTYDLAPMSNVYDDSRLAENKASVIELND